MKDIPVGYDFIPPDAIQIGGFHAEPQSIDSPLYPVSECDPEMLPEPLRGWLVDIAERMNCPLDFVAVASLSMLGSLIGTRCAVRPKLKDSWIELANIWGGIVAPPSSKKSPAISEVTKPLKMLESESFKIFAEESKRANVRLSILEKRSQYLLNTSKNKSGDDLNSLEKELQEIQNQIYEAKPVQKRFIVNDTTPEKMVDICVQNPQGILAYRDELSGLIRSWDKPGNETARSMYLEGWNGKETFKVDRIVRGSTHVETFCLTVFGGIQPDKLQSLLLSQLINGENDGIMQRFQLLVYPDEPKYMYPDRYPNKSEQDKAFNLIRLIANADENTFCHWGAERNDFDKIPSIKFSDEARNLFSSWHEENHSIATADESSQYEKEILAKYPKLMAGLSLIFHVVDCASDKNSKQIELHNVQRAYNWCKYLLSHAKRISGIASRPKQSALLLSKKISSNAVEDEFTPRLIVQKGWQGLGDTKTVTEAIELLVDANWLFDITDTNSKPGRPSKRYQVNMLARNWYKQNKNT